MAMLEGASGAGFDEMFLTMMIEHHEGAVQMAKTQVANGENPDAIAMAEQIITTQEAELMNATNRSSPSANGQCSYHSRNSLRADHVDMSE